MGSPQNQPTRTLGPTLRILQINIESISRAKSEYLSKLLLDERIDVVTLQETHCESEIQLHSRGKIPGYNLLAATYHRTYGTATYARNSLTNIRAISTSDENEIFTITVEINNNKICNVYKPPSVRWPEMTLPVIEHPAVYTGDFNSHHTQWKYRDTNEDGVKLVEWADSNNMALIFDPKDIGTFKSGRWGTETNPDLCFVTRNSMGNTLPITRHVLPHFPHSQHRPVLLEIGIQIQTINSSALPRWNFSKADWKRFSADLDKNIRWIPPLAKNYDRFVKMTIATAKKYIPRGVRTEYIPGWNETCERLYSDFQKSGQTDVADELLHELDIARRNKWNETISNMNFRHSSRKA